jgi:hypothetical protein
VRDEGTASQPVKMRVVKRSLANFKIGGHDATCFRRSEPHPESRQMPLVGVTLG